MNTGQIYILISILVLAVIFLIFLFIRKRPPMSVRAITRLWIDIFIN